MLTKGSTTRESHEFIRWEYQMMIFNILENDIYFLVYSIRIEAIVDHILNKYNVDDEELFKYDLNDKELIKYLLNFDFDLLYEEAPEQFQKEEIIETVLEQSYYIENTEMFETSKERIIQFLNSNLKGRLRINHEFVDEELVKLFKEKKVVYERIDD